MTTQVDAALLGIAKVCHEANRAFCQTIGDDSQPTWEDAPDWQRDSAINGVKFHIEAPRRVDESHANWMQEKLETGWKYGPVKDPEKKEHPCMVPYDQLPEDQKYKDAIFLSVVAALSPILINAIAAEESAKESND